MQKPWPGTRSIGALRQQRLVGGVTLREAPSAPAPPPWGGAPQRPRDGSIGAPTRATDVNSSNACSRFAALGNAGLCVETAVMALCQDAAVERLVRELRFTARSRAARSVASDMTVQAQAAASSAAALSISAFDLPAVAVPVPAPPEVAALTRQPRDAAQDDDDAVSNPDDDAAAPLQNSDLPAGAGVDLGNDDDDDDEDGETAGLEKPAARTVDGDMANAQALGEWTESVVASMAPALDAGILAARESFSKGARAPTVSVVAMPTAAVSRARTGRIEESEHAVIEDQATAHCRDSLEAAAAAARSNLVVCASEMQDSTIVTPEGRMHREIAVRCRDAQRVAGRAEYTCKVFAVFVPPLVSP